MRTIGTPSTQVRKLNAIASGALPNGDPVVVNADGTVSVVAETAVSQAIGSFSVFDAGPVGVHVSSSFDSLNNKVVIAYADDGNSEYGTAVVGTVSGTSISFGTPVVFQNSSTAYCAVTFDETAGKTVICYSDGGAGDQGKAIVGTVSGTSISFGSSSVFESGGANFITSLFESNSDKIVVTYRDTGNGNKGTAVVGTVSGTSISFGSPVVFYSSQESRLVTATFDSTSNKIAVFYEDNAPSDNRVTGVVGTVSGTSISFGSPTDSGRETTNDAMSSTFDSLNGKCVVAYRDKGNSNYPSIMVSTISGTSISFGSPVVLNSSGTSEPTALVFDGNANKVVAFYFDSSASEGKLKVGTVSGTGISFGSAVTFSPNSNYLIGPTGATFDSTSNKVVLGYLDTGDSKGKAVVFQNSGTAINLTAENYIGLSSNGYPDTAGATIDVQGAINDRQSGLTAGQTYYVQTDGTLTTTAGDPSVFAGTAISATKMIVKG